MTGAFHGGAFWDALDPTFPAGYDKRDVIAADVLDAWFPPAPGVIGALCEGAARLARTSPPTHAEGLSTVLARERDLPVEAIVTGAGSSDLLYRALPAWLDRNSRVLLTEPTYGEYVHLIEEVIGARVDRFPARDGLDSVQWEEALNGGRYDLAVLVNPNNPTGGITPREEIVHVARRTQTRILIDEAYMDYLSPSQSVQDQAAQLSNLVVVRSLSKGLALSGLRVGYMVVAPPEAERLRRLTPPWNVSGPAQIAAIRALEDPSYYTVRYRETHVLRRKLAARFGSRGFDISEGINWILVCVEDAATFVAEAAKRRVFLRDAGRTAPSYGNEWVRIGVGDETTQDEMLSRLFDAN